MVEGVYNQCFHISGKFSSLFPPLSPLPPPSTSSLQITSNTFATLSPSASPSLPNPNPSLEASLKPKFQCQGQNPSLKAIILASRLIPAARPESMPQGQNPCLRTQSPILRPKSQPQTQDPLHKAQSLTFRP